MDKDHKHVYALWVTVLCIGLIAGIGWVVPGWMELATKPKPKIEAKKEPKGLRPLAELMPQFEIRPTTNGMWHIWSKTHNSTNWMECSTDMPTEDAAWRIIATIRRELWIKYETGKLIVDALERRRGD